MPLYIINGSIQHISSQHCKVPYYKRVVRVSVALFTGHSFGPGGKVPTLWVSIQRLSCVMSMNTRPPMRIMQVLKPLVSALKIHQRIMGSVIASWAPANYFTVLRCSNFIVKIHIIICTSQ